MTDLTIKLLEHFTPFQKLLHDPEDLDKGPDYYGNKIRSDLYREDKKTTWFTHYPQLSEYDIKEKNIIIFKINTFARGLQHSDLIQDLPSIICKEGYEARWIDDIISNICIEGTFNFDDQTIQTVDTLLHDIKLNSDTPDYQYQKIKENIGNRSELINWNKKLPKAELNIFLPWMYNKDDITSYFPLYNCGGENNINHKIKYESKLNKLLLVRKILGDGKYENVDIKEGIYQINDTQINDNNNDNDVYVLNILKMNVEYLLLSDIECENNRFIDPNVLNNKNVIYYHDMISVDVDVDINNQDKNEIILPIKCSYPIHMFVWVGENITLKNKGIYGKYTTQDNNSPILSSSLCLDESSFLFKDLSSHRTQNVYPLKHFCCVPKNKGMNFWVIGGKINSLNFQPGIVINNGSLIIKIDNTECKEDKFIYRLKLIITKKLTFKTFPSNDQEKKDFKSIIKIEGKIRENRTSENV